MRAVAAETPMRWPAPGIVSNVRRVVGTAPVIPLLILFVALVVAIGADAIAPHSFIQIAPAKRLLPPFTEGYILGSDSLGRDVLSRLIFGTRASLAVAFVSVLAGGGIGLVLGLISGYRGGYLDTIIMRTADALLGFPLILFAILLAAVFEPSFSIVLIVLALGMWPRFARIVRGEVLVLRERDFVAMARVAGATSPQIILWHIAPHLINSFIVIASLQAAWAIVVESSLSFFGAGVPPPSPSWGGMVSDGRTYVTTAWWISVFPGLAIALLVMGLNLLGDWLRDWLDPTLRQAG